VFSSDRIEGGSTEPAPHHTVERSVADWLHVYGGPKLLPGELLCDRHVRDGRVALVFEDTDRTSDLSYAELRELSVRFAAALLDRGVTPGDRVGVLLPRSPELLVALLGIWRAGAVEIPLFTAFGPEAVAYRLNRGRAVTLVTDTENRHKLEPGACPEVHSVFCLSSKGAVAASDGIDFTGAIARATSLREEPRDGSDPFILLFTSGTTGRGKGVPVPCRALASIHAYMHYSLDLRDDDVFWNASDPGWGYGLWYGIVGSLLLGRTMLLRAGAFDPAATLETLLRRGVTNFAGAATLYRSLRATGVPADFKQRASLRALSSAGEPLDPDLVEWSEASLGVPIHDHYGQSEVGMIIGCPHHPELATTQVPGSMGGSLPGFLAVTLDERGGEVQTSAGEIAVDVEHSPLYWFNGYDDDPENTADRFRHGRRYYLTGDRARIEPDGTFRFLGRDDDVITSAGYRIGPFDVESVLTAHPAVREAAVIGTPDPARGEAVTAFIVLDELIEPPPTLAEELQELVRARLGKHLYPRRIVFADSLPRSTVGKIDRIALRKQWHRDHPGDDLRRELEARTT
jgi:acetyl-CoA synthetase